MVAAVMVAVIVMIGFAGAIGRFVERHPTVKMLALSFLLLIGMTLMAEGFDQHISKGYIYSGDGFFRVCRGSQSEGKKAAEPVKFHESYSEG